MDTTAAGPAAPAEEPVELPGLGTEVRESLLLLGLSLGVTVGLTAVVQALLSAVS